VPCKRGRACRPARYLENVVHGHSLPRGRRGGRVSGDVCPEVFGNTALERPYFIHLLIVSFVTGPFAGWRGRARRFDHEEVASSVYRTAASPRHTVASSESPDSWSSCCLARGLDYFNQVGISIVHPASVS